MILVDGEARDTVSALDRGLHYGDGVFETLRVRAGAALHWPAHYARLTAGAGRLGIPVPDARVFEADIRAVSADRAECIVKLLLTRGAGPRGYRVAGPVVPSRIVMASPLPDFPDEWRARGVAARFCETRLGGNPALAGIKHLNRLEQVVARAEWDDDRIAEGLLRDGAGHVVEGTMSNLFIVLDGVLVTPDLSACGVAGITRARVLEAAAAAGLATRVRPVSVDDCRRASEMFLTNTVIGVWTVREVDGIRYAGGEVAAAMRRAIED